jgi:hypothetical protein
MPRPRAEAFASAPRAPGPRAHAARMPDDGFYVSYAPCLVFERIVEEKAP